MCLLLGITKLQAQVPDYKMPTGNIRLSFLIIPPFSPLLTLELRTFSHTPVQMETNFVNTHGINLKYFIRNTMDEHFVFVGTAFIESDFLRKDLKPTILPYAGYGYAHRFGKSREWIFDNRLGFGATTNADKNVVSPVFKSGIGKTF
jgi:hypothetical protein